MTQNSTPPQPVRCARQGFWLKLGFISFGGPAGQIAILHQELVERRRWISERRFLHALNYCMLLPGPEAQQLATYIGWLLHRTGGIVAGGLFVLPSLLILIACRGPIWLLASWVWWQACFTASSRPLWPSCCTALRIGQRALKTACCGAGAGLLLALAVFDCPFR
jgi:chromate transporter